MTVDPEYMDYATECIRLAGLTDDLDVRNQLVELAGRYLADVRDERRTQLDNVIPLRRQHR